MDVLALKMRRTSILRAQGLTGNEGKGAALAAFQICETKNVRLFSRPRLRYNRHVQAFLRSKEVAMRRLFANRLAVATAVVVVLGSLVFAAVRVST
jgi:hypothetical protein